MENKPVKYDPECKLWNAVLNEQIKSSDLDKNGNPRDSIRKKIENNENDENGNENGNENNEQIKSEITELNEHSDYIDKRIVKFIYEKDKWNSILINTSHDDFVKDYASCVFTNLIKDFFLKTYVKKHKCSDCNNQATERCHGIGESRPDLIRKALKKVWPDTTKPITLKQIIIAYIEEHKYTKFTFKCHSCHLKDRKKEDQMKEDKKLQNYMKKLNI